MSVDAIVKSVSDFTDEETTDLRELKTAVYPERPEGYPERQREWEAPRWGVLIRDGEGRLVSHAGVVLRSSEVDGEAKMIGGIGGVATHPDHQGRGYAPLAMGRALDFLLAQGADFALLVCRDDLVDYYTRLGWRRFDGRVLDLQHGEPEVFTFNQVMVGDLNAPAPDTGTIDLCGPPW